MSDLIPNSYQTPNAYVDRLMDLVTPEEWKVLSYAARRIFGFHKRQDHISQSQFIHGTISQADGHQLDCGTGLSKPAVIKAIKSLLKYGIMIEISKNDSRLNNGALYELQLDSNQIDMTGLIERANEANRINLSRSAKARKKAAEMIENTRSVGLTGSKTEDPVSGTDGDQSVGLTGTGQSDRPIPVSGTDTQKKEETKKKQSRKEREGGAGAPAADKAKETDPLLKHPAVVIYRDVMHLTPNDVQRQLIAERVGSDGHIDDWRAVLIDWKAHSWKPGNVPGQLEVFSKKIGANHESITGTTQPGNRTPESPSASQLAAAERINAARAAKSGK